MPGNAPRPDIIQPARFNPIVWSLFHLDAVTVGLHPLGTPSVLRSPRSLDRGLEETAIFKILFDDDVRHSVEHNLDVLGVCGTRQVGVDFFLALLHVQVQELRLDVVAGVVVRVGPCSLERWGGDGRLVSAPVLRPRGVSVQSRFFLTVVVREADAEVHLLDLLLEEILLVEEEHDGGQRKESVVADAVE